ncbi:hypothetical protein F5Y11DRAFT_366590 [Daldinia sp. FL1419]|nr:hypothetical protein F5Y11DRAFT_366590 [Daldinia sp. FL1419]
MSLSPPSNTNTNTDTNTPMTTSTTPTPNQHIPALTPMSAMDSLPEEILISILDKLDRKADISTILRLRGVNRKWQRVATPYIHIAVQNFTEHPKHPSSRSRSHSGTATAPWNFHRSTDLLAYLCWKLAQKPQLARFVKEVASRPWKDAAWRTGTERAALQRGYEGALGGHGGIGEHVKARIVKGMFSPCDAGDAMLAFVLVLCGELEALMVPALDRGCGALTREVLGAARARLESPDSAPTPGLDFGLFGAGRGAGGSMLGALRYVQLGDYVNGLGLSDALDLLALPKLRHLELGNLGDTTLDETRPISALQDPDLGRRKQAYLLNRGPVDITLESCRLSSKGLGVLLAACGRPRSLFIKMRTGNVRPSRAPCFAEALEKYGAGLEFLYLDTTAFEIGLADSSSNPDPNTHPNSSSSSSSSSSSTPLSPSLHFLRALTSLTPTLRFLALSRADLPSPSSLSSSLPLSLRELLILECDDDDGYRSFVRGLDTPILERVVCQRATANSDTGAIYDSCLRERKLPPNRVLERCRCAVYT